MANKRNKKDGSAYQHLTERVLREDAMRADAKKQANGLKLTPTTANERNVSRAKKASDALACLKSKIPPQKDWRTKAARKFREEATKSGNVPPVKVLGEAMQQALSTSTQSASYKFRRDMARAGERYMRKHKVSAVEVLCVLTDFAAAWASRVEYALQCPSRRKGDKECKCVRH
jgi:hypothetical protein